MSILKSNSANFKITIEWLKNRGYEQNNPHEDDPRPTFLYYFGRRDCVIHLKYEYKLHIENYSYEGELVSITAISENKQVIEIKNVNDLIKIENYWMKGTIFKSRDMFDKIKDISK